MPNHSHLPRASGYLFEAFANTDAMFSQNAPIEAFVDPLDAPQTRPFVSSPVGVASAVGPPPKPGKAMESKVPKKKWYKKTQVRKSDKPKRPLSGYNLFFQDARKQLLEVLPAREGSKPMRTHGKINFQDMAKRISSMWNNLDEETKSYYQALGGVERDRYYQALKEYNDKKKPTENLSNRESQMACTRTGMIPQDSTAKSDPLMPLELTESPSSTNELTSRVDPDTMNHFLHIFR